MWSFLNPMFLWAAAAAVVPLILHLMQRRRTVRLPFSTIRFLKLAQKRSANRIRMENFLLWLLRTLLLLTIAAAFAVPVLRTTQFGRLTGIAHRDVALVLDSSYSMRYETGQRRVWETVQDAATAVLRGLQSGDRVCVFLADEHPTALVEKPNADLALVERLIKDRQPNNGSSQLPEAVVAACRALEDSKHREREVYVLTDGQALPWKGFQTTAEKGATNRAVKAGLWDPSAIDPKVAFFTLLAGPLAPENVWPCQVEVEPALLLSNTTATITAHLGRTGPSQSLAVALLVDDQEVSRRTAVIDANGTRAVAFTLPALAPGVHGARIETPADGLVADDAFYFLIRVRQALPTLCVGSSEDAFFLRTALHPAQPAEESSVKRIDPSEVATAALRNYSTIFLLNALPLPGQAMLALEDFVRAGGTLAIFPGDSASPANYADWSILPAKPDALAESAQDDRVCQLRLVAGQDPLFAGFALPPGAIPTLSIRRHLAWKQLEPEARTVIAAGNDLPFLSSRYVGKGRVLLCSVSADRRWSTLPTTAFFLPMVHQIVQFGAGLAREPPYLWTSPTLLLSEIIPDAHESDRFLTPRGTDLSVRPVRKEANVLLEADGVDEPGIYLRLRSGGVKEPAFAINLRREESNLEPVDTVALPALTGLRELRVTRDPAQLQQAIDEHRRGRPLTEAFFWMAFVLAVAEVLLANRISRRRTTAAGAVQVDASGRVSGGAEHG